MSIYIHQTVMKAAACIS